VNICRASGKDEAAIGVHWEEASVASDGRWQIGTVHVGTAACGRGISTAPVCECAGPARERGRVIRLRDRYGVALSEPIGERLAELSQRSSVGRELELVRVLS